MGRAGILLNRAPMRHAAQGGESPSPMQGAVVVTPKAPRWLCLKVMRREQRYSELIFLLRAGAGFVVAEELGEAVRQPLV